jgi:uncharacterized protein with HEPN domain
MRRLSLDLREPLLADFCRRWKISELALFGSALRDDFNPESDVDVLVTFVPSAHWSLLDLVRMQDELSGLWKRPVDLLTRRAVERSQNWIRRKAILLDIAKAARLALEFARGLDQDAFLEDPKTQSPVSHQLMVLGEAVKRLSDEFCACRPAIPWRQIAGMRDRLIHGYDVVDLDEVWLVLEKDLPELLKQLDPLLPKASA